MVLASHVSGNIEKKQALAFWDAGVFAFCINKPLNWFITIHLSKGCVDRPHDCVSRFLKLASEWVRRKTGDPACWCYVFENHNGLQAHILLHVPHEHLRQFKARERGWALHAGVTLYPTVFDSRRIWYSEPSSETRDYLEIGLLGILRYLLKGIEPSEAAAFGIEYRNQGKVCGKRVAHSESLGRQHRWKRIVVRPKSGLSIAGQDTRRKHLARALCPELLRLAT